MRGAFLLALAWVGCSASNPSASDAGDLDAASNDVNANDVIASDGSNNDASVETSDVPFTATGPWRSKFPPTTPIATNSAAIVANIQADIKNNYGTFAINTDTYSSPIFTVPANTQTQNWTYNNCQGNNSPSSAFTASLKGIPTLSSMITSQGTDAEITIYSPSLDQEWEFWVAKNTNNAWSACYGGTITSVSTNPGIFSNGLGATACGLPLLGFLVRIDELAQKKITHAINIETVRTQKATFSWPANRTDGNTADVDILMEGQRMRLDPTFDITTLPNTAEQTIAKAMQDYGILLTDTSGAVVMQVEDPRPSMTAQNTTVNPYDALFEGRASYDVLKEIPLDKLQVLPKDYGQDFMK